MWGVELILSMVGRVGGWAQGNILKHLCLKKSAMEKGAEFELRACRWEGGAKVSTKKYTEAPLFEKGRYEERRLI